MFEDDNNKLANINDTKEHLDFIFNTPYNNNAFLVLQIENDELISMVNFLEYNNKNNEWCLFLLYTNMKYINKGYGLNIMFYSIDKLNNYKCSKLISGIERDNISSIKLHEKAGFKYSDCKWNELAEGFPDDHLRFIYIKK